MGNTLLHCAAFGGNVDNFRVIYEEFGLSLYKPNDYGLTPVFIASGGSVPLLEYLRGKGVDFSALINDNHNYKNYAGWRAVHYATERGSLDSVRYLVEECGCDPNALTFQDSNCAMIAAGINLRLMLYFVETWKHTLTPVNRFGENSALIAAKYGKLDIFKELIYKHRVNPFIKNIQGAKITDLIKGKPQEAAFIAELDTLQGINFKRRGLMCALWTRVHSA
jgi:ankyrin repeat protein